jgi:hypothetical protein
VQILPKAGPLGTYTQTGATGTIGEGSRAHSEEIIYHVKVLFAPVCSTGKRLQVRGMALATMRDPTSFTFTALAPAKLRVASSALFRTPLSPANQIRIGFHLRRLQVTLSPFAFPQRRGSLPASGQAG